MLKLHQLYLRKILILFIVLFFTIGGIIYYWVKDFYIEQTKISLLHNIELTSFKLQELDNFDKLVLDIKKKLNLRVTIIDQEGKVQAESHEDKKLMDNHRYREEILQSDLEGFGFVIRRSDTIKVDLLYVVKKYTIKDKIYYIRFARPLDAINAQISALGVKVIGVLIIFFIFLFYKAYRISIQLQSETDNILHFLLKLTKKRKGSYINSEFSYEFAQITLLLTKVSKILTKKDKQKSKYTAKLKASNSQKDDIISAISHEFKNPISVINGYSQTLIDDENMNQEIQKKFLKKIHKSGTRLSTLIDTLRLSIKLEEGKQPLKYKDINLYGLVEDCIESLQSNYKNRDITLNANKELTIRADETLLSIAVINLIENALKYSEDTVNVIIDNNYISISDTGIGIKESDLQNITNKFYRVSSNGWNNSLGLGLSIVTNILNIHSFKLHIDTKENEGSTFTIEF